MKITSILLVLLLLCAGKTYSQNKRLDSLTRELAKAPDDTSRIKLRNVIAASLMENNIDSGIVFTQKTIELAKAAGFVTGEAAAHRSLAHGHIQKGDYALAKTELETGEKLAKSVNDIVGLARNYANYGMFYGMQSKYDSSIYYYNKTIDITKNWGDKNEVSRAYQNIAIDYQMLSNFKQALNYQNKSLQIADAANDISGLAYVSVNMAITYQSLNDTVQAEKLYLNAIDYAKKAEIKNVELYAYSNLSSLYEQNKSWHLCYDYGMKAAALGRQTGDVGITAVSLSKAAVALAYQKKFSDAETLSAQAVIIADSTHQPLNIFQTLSNRAFVKKAQTLYPEAIALYEKGFAALKDADIYASQIGNSYGELANCYEALGNYQKALASYKISTKINDTIRSRDNVQRATELSMNYEFDKKEQTTKAEQDKLNATANTKQTALIIGLLLTVAIIGVVIYAYSNKQKANNLLQKQKGEIQTTLTELKATQAQLVQSEKMASLGELTAGIAHEIQNPLNFVNNFSEVSAELLDEMQAELDSGNKDEAEQIATEIKQNLQKIVHHGKRADAIVKGMLQHSRTSTGQKEPVLLNSFANDYLRLSYQGLRAKDKTFNSALSTDFDQSIEKINIIPQDLGRVLLNLFTNAFYSVAQKEKKQIDGYKPEVSLTTKRLNNSIQICVRDNGSGVPQKIKEKIYQPFFTTKPTGEGTGLGLSLSFDIITKGHGGTLQLNTEEGEFAEFVITIPA